MMATCEPCRKRRSSRLVFRRFHITTKDGRRHVIMRLERGLTRASMLDDNRLPIDECDIPPERKGGAIENASDGAPCRVLGVRRADSI